ncbi:MAG: hypothetical protein PHW60_08125 [Kiritimatiellae bacterium]|nr:hypothetical protein [Kiritimatiellia bacterium]
MQCACDEIQRQYRVIDQTLTMYSVLRDRYSRLALIIILGVLAASVFLCAFTFTPDDILRLLGVSEPIARLALALLSAFVFFLSIANLCLGWSDKSAQFGQAAESVYRLKTIYRSILIKNADPTFDALLQLHEEYKKGMEGLPRIPDSEFLRLKAYHLRKVEISKMISLRPGYPVWVLRAILLIRGRFKDTTKEAERQ